MNGVVQVRFKVNGEFTPWEPEIVRSRAMGQTPTAVQRITELRRKHPEAAIAIERRGDSRPEKPPMSRFSIYVRSGSMPVYDPNGINGISIVQIDKQTLFSRPFTEGERDSVRMQIYEQFPNAQLIEMRV